MKSLVCMFVLCVAMTGCATESQVCASDNCVCPATTSCDHTCADGAAQCHIQGAPSQAVDATCSNNAECHVECGQSSSCRVECGGSDECHVTCPPTGCTVTGCVGAACVVACASGGTASRTGTTATCP